MGETLPERRRRAPQRPILSPIARPGRRYISGMIYLALVLSIALLFVGARLLLG